MKQEILLKAYVVHQSEEAFRELVAASLDEVYSTAFRIVRGASHLAEETSLRVFLELARNAPRLSEVVVLESWLHEHTCKIAVIVLRENGRSVDGPTLKSEMQEVRLPNDLQPAPTGLGTRIWQGVFLDAPQNKHFRFRPLTWLPRLARIQSKHVKLGSAAAICLLVILFLWHGPFHRRSHQIIQSEAVLLTPDSFAQLGKPEDGDVPATTNGAAAAKIENDSRQQ